MVWTAVMGNDFPGRRLIIIVYKITYNKIKQEAV